MSVVHCPISTNRIFYIGGVPYLELHLLGRGGSSEVLKVIDPEMKMWALKIVDLRSANDSAVRLFQNEVALLGRLQNAPHIIQLRTSERRRGYLLMVLELGTGDLAQLTEQRLDVTLVRLWFAQMLKAVATIHEAGVVHGDLKLPNFLVVEGRLKLIDFGIARRIPRPDETTSVERTTVQGTVGFMPPEALTRQGADGRYKVGRSADVWSLGCILYTLLYGNGPFDHMQGWMDKMALIRNDRFEIPFPEPAVPRSMGLVEVARACLQREPKARPTVDALMQNAFITGQGGSFIEQVRQIVLMVQDDYPEVNWRGEDGAPLLAEIAAAIRSRRPLEALRPAREEEEEAWDSLDQAPI